MLSCVGLTVRRRRDTSDSATPTLRAALAPAWWLKAWLAEPSHGVGATRLDGSARRAGAARGLVAGATNARPRQLPRAIGVLVEASAPGLPARRRGQPHELRAGEVTLPRGRATRGGPPSGALAPTAMRRARLSPMPSSTAHARTGRLGGETSCAVPDAIMGPRCSTPGPSVPRERHAPVDGPGLLQYRRQVVQLAGRAEPAGTPGQVLQAVDPVQALLGVPSACHVAAVHVHPDRAGVSEGLPSKHVGVSPACRLGHNVARRTEISSAANRQCSPRTSAVASTPSAVTSRRRSAPGPLRLTSTARRSPASAATVSPGPRPATASSSHGPLVAMVRPLLTASWKLSTLRGPSTLAYTRAQTAGFEKVEQQLNESKQSVPAVTARRQPAPTMRR